MPKVYFLNEAVEAEAKAGQTIAEVAERYGIVLYRGIWPGLHCHGHGLCGRCRVWARPLRGGALSPLSLWERLRRYRNTRRLACQAKVLGDVEVRSMPNAPPPRQSTVWPADTRPAKWKERAAAPPETKKPAAETPAAQTPTPAKPTPEKPEKAAPPAAAGSTSEKPEKAAPPAEVAPAPTAPGAETSAPAEAAKPHA